MSVFCVAPPGMMIAYGGSRERISSVDSDKARFGSLERDRSPSFGRRNSAIEMSPPHHILMSASPPNAGSNAPPLRFVPQPLSEETLMDVSLYSFKIPFIKQIISNLRQEHLILIQI